MTFFKSDELNELAAIAEKSDKWIKESQMTGQNGERLQVWQCQITAPSFRCSSMYKDYHLTEGFNEEANKAAFKKALVDSLIPADTRLDLLLSFLSSSKEKSLMEQWKHLLSISNVAFYQKGDNALVIEANPSLEGIDKINEGREDMHVFIGFSQNGTHSNCFVIENNRFHKGTVQDYAKYYNNN